MNLEALLTVAALGAAAYLLLTPKNAAAAAPSTPLMLAPGGAGSIWNDASQTRYRNELAAALAKNPEFYI
ncbi:hypothetical protein ACNI65_10000 [Roseateles sp. So40a]|uniref:hypothetical protein n=1 Tax=Roseateles sp. So40a TaxID=3400226 RepID=UPI003A8B6ADB